MKQKKSKGAKKKEERARRVRKALRDKANREQAKGEEPTP